MLVPLGLLTKFYSGPGSDWVATQAGGFLYVVFWVFLVLAIAPGLCAGVVSAAVFAVTCALEILQLWHPPLLIQLRSTFLGHALLGSTFSWIDIPYYAAGCLVAYAAARIVQSHSKAPAD
ncbi:MAG: DUF2809 domain-containing protein [Myxococcota bacterium]